MVTLTTVDPPLAIAPAIERLVVSTGAPVVPLQFFTGNFVTLAIAFALLAIVAALLGARGVAGISMTIAKWFVILFVVLAILSLVL